MAMGCRISQQYVALICMGSFSCLIIVRLVPLKSGIETGIPNSRKLRRVCMFEPVGVNNMAVAAHAPGTSKPCVGTTFMRTSDHDHNVWSIDDA